MDKHIEERIKEALNRGNEVTQKDKDDMWAAIEQRMDSEEKEKSTPFRTLRSKPFMTFFTTAAAAVLLFAGAQTEGGSALVDKVKESFEPEKEISVAIEGQQEVTTMSLPTTGTFATEATVVPEYVIYVDETRYALINDGEVDRIVPKILIDERYPEVSMEIQHRNGQTAEELIPVLENELAGEYGELKPIETVEQPLQGQLLENVPGTDWNSPKVKQYVIDDEKGGSYVITQKYFLEAAEGHGVRFDEMLGEFHLLPDER